MALAVVPWHALHCARPLLSWAAKPLLCEWQLEAVQVAVPSGLVAV
jgi:hypothetical protein